ncbi:MAG: TolC family protein [Firmicutes bacterium]|nr:TolC family protein [Bacillota bacterium]
MREAGKIRQIAIFLMFLVLTSMSAQDRVLAEAGQTEDALVITAKRALELADEHNLTLAGARLDVEYAEKQLTKAQADATISPSPVALRQAEIALETQKLLLEQTQRQVALQVQNAYFGATSKMQQRDIAMTNLEQVEEQLRIITVKYGEGLATKLDLFNAEKGVLQAKSSLEAAEAAAELSLLDLKRVLGLSYTENVCVEPADTLIEPVDLAMEQVVEKVLRHNLDLTRMQWNLEVSQMQEESAKNDYTAPLIREIHTNRRMKAELDLKEGTRLAYLQAKEAWNSLIQAEGMVAVAEKELEAAEENYRITKIRFDGGLEIPNNLLRAQIALTSAQHSVVTSKFEYHLARIRLLNLMGE